MLYKEFLRHSCVTAHTRHKEGYSKLYIFIESILCSFTVFVYETKIYFNEVTRNIAHLI